VTFNKKIAQMVNVLLTVSDYKDVNNALKYATTISFPAMIEGLFGRVIYS